MNGIDIGTARQIVGDLPQPILVAVEHYDLDTQRRAADQGLLIGQIVKHEDELTAEGEAD